MGMTEEQFGNEWRELVFQFVAAPALILFGMYFAGSLIDTFTDTKNTFSFIFLGIGGAPGIGVYYFMQLKKRGWIK